ncbi:MAG: hypothetical protein IPL53_12725 [Ignavibacteria bacterium]|nr:hypothetical protein [Ignavibacteria bacterium]
MKYSWEVKGTEFGNRQLASSEVYSINVFPNPYGLSDLEDIDDGARFTECVSSSAKPQYLLLHWTEHW